MIFAWPFRRIHLILPLLIILFFAVSPAQSGDREVLQNRIKKLSSTEMPLIDGAPIAAVPGITKVCELREWEPAWNFDRTIGDRDPVRAVNDTLNSRDIATRLAQVSPTLRAEVLELALTAYERAKASGVVRRPVLTIIDYELPSYEKRLWVINMEARQLVHEEWVAHGMGRPRGSGGTMTHALSFSNRRGSCKSSLGLFLTAETYFGSHGYTLRLDGLENGFNNNARDRLIVLHGAHYVSKDQARNHLTGRSWGCPAVRAEISKKLIDSIKGGSLLWVYFPEPQWLEGSEFLDADRKTKPAGSVSDRNQS